MATRNGDRQGRRRRSARIPASGTGVEVLWTAFTGVRCVVARYDETRYQLRLLRDGGTIKAELFSDRAEAITSSHEWRRQIENGYFLDWNPGD
jgi:hypothetical protein